MASQESRTPAPAAVGDAATSSAERAGTSTSAPAPSSAASAAAAPKQSAQAEEAGEDEGDDDEDDEDGDNAEDNAAGGSGGAVGADGLTAKQRKKKKSKAAAKLKKKLGLGSNAEGGSSTSQQQQSELQELLPESVVQTVRDAVEKEQGPRASANVNRANIAKLLKQMQLERGALLQSQDEKARLSTQKQLADHKFWKTQPVAKPGEVAQCRVFAKRTSVLIATSPHPHRRCTS